MGLRLTSRTKFSLLRCFAAVVVALSILASVTAPAFAAGGQFGNLNGTIVDAQTKAPIAGAHISAKSGSGNYTATTDAKGFFVILGMSVDSYTVTIEATGHETQNLTGVPVFGDETDTVGTVAMVPSLKTIATTHSRSTGSAFQPTQTIDQYTVSGAQIVQATGNAASTNENAIFLSVPGVTLTNAGTVTIRGGAATEVGYQYDGIPFKEPFYGFNGSPGLANGIGSVQIVEGAGDATQGNVGSGVVNVIPLRGSGSGSGTVDFEAGGPYYFHQFSANYGFSTPNNRWSEYAAFSGQNGYPPTGYRFDPQDQYLDAFTTTRQANNQFVENLVYRFGKNNHESLQGLYTNISAISYGPNGTPFGYYYPYPGSIFNGYWSGFLNGAIVPAFGGTGAFTPNQVAALTPLNNYTPSTNITPSGSQVADSIQTRLLKLEYDNSLNATTYLAIKYFNWAQYSYTDSSYVQGAYGSGIPNPAWGAIGGPQSGFIADLTKQFGTNLTVTLDGSYDNIRPVWDGQQPALTYFGLGGFVPDFVGANAAASTGLPVGYLCNGNGGAPFSQFAAGCASSLGIAGQLPNWGIGFQQAQFQNWGYGIRFQWEASDKLHVDFGVRQEGQNEHWQNQLNTLGVAGLPGANPFDVPPSFWTSSVLYPSETEPRISISYQLDRNDSLRFGYGRSAVFSNAQDSGTPFNMTGLSNFLGIPANPNGPGCRPGSAPANANIVSVPVGKPGCTLYVQQLYWNNDIEYPDAGNTLPSIYNNYDLTYSHQFKNGWGARITGFRKIGNDIPAAVNLNPILGIFETANLGLNRTTGAEFELNTPEKAVGLSGFLSMTYQNVLSSTPPLSQAETSVPQVTLATLTLGNLYRAGYVSPFVIQIGAQENFKNGLQIIPQLHYDIGYPYSVGNLIAEQINGYGGAVSYANIPQANLTTWTNTQDSSPLLGIGGLGGAAGSTNYVDPANPGSIFNPNIAATRGTNGTAANGGILSHPNLEANLTVQLKKGQNTFGIQFFNLFGNGFVSSVPAPNTFYQPVATGLGGPQTGWNPCQLQVPISATYNCAAQLPYSTFAFKNGAYVLSNGNFNAGPSIAPLNPFGFHVFFQRSI